MKTAPKIILLFKDDGFDASLSEALRPHPSSTLRRREDDFELSLERYGIQDLKASGKLIHFVDDTKGLYQVSLLLLQHYEPPFLACILNEVLTSIKGEGSLSMPSIVLPCVVSPSKLKLEARNSTVDVSKVSLYGIQIGPRANIAESLITGTQKPPSLLQIHHEPLACFLQLASVLKVPTFVLIGQRDQHPSSTNSGEEMFHEIGELLARTTGLYFKRGEFKCSRTDKSRDVSEPWCALYG